MKDTDFKIPDQKELEKELNEYLGKKYGDRVRLVVPMLFPKTQAEEVSKEEKDPGDEGKKKKIQFDLKPEEINCDGCKSEGGKLIGYCRSCEIRQCCNAKRLDNCSFCSDQPCETLVKFHNFSPEAKACFEALKV